MIEIYQNKDFIPDVPNYKFLLQPEILYEYCFQIKQDFNLKYFNNWPKYGYPRIEYRDNQIKDLLNEINKILDGLEKYIEKKPPPEYIEYESEIDEYGEETEKVSAFTKEKLYKFLIFFKELIEDTIEKELNLYFAGD